MTTGSAQYPYPGSTAVPDVPADILLLTQRLALMNGSGTGFVADATALAATITDGDAFTGWSVYHAAADCVVSYNGSAFKLVGTKRFADVAAQTSWTTTYSGLLEAGSLSYAVDTTITYRYSGSAWVAWNSPWFTRTPTLNNITLGTGGTSYFRARYVEGDIEEKLKVAFGTSGAAWTTSPNWTLLAAPDPLSYAAISQVGRGSAYDASATIDYDITANWTGSGSTVNLYVRGTAATYLALGIITASAPFTPATNDTVTVRLAYTPA